MGLTGEDAREREERLVEAAMAVLQATPDQELKIVLLNKALFYLDLVALRDTGETVTHATYVALKQGPVVAKYPERLVPALEKRGLALQGQDGDAKPVRVTKVLSEFQYLVGELRDVAEAIGKKVAGLTSAQASNFSHDNPGWQVAYSTGLGAGSRVKTIDMTLAMQQLDDAPADRDSWLDANPDDELLKAFRDAATTS
jgi:hypothetical protein